MENINIETNADSLEKDWNVLVKKLSLQFDGDLDVSGILFLIGLQELGIGYRKYSKDQKLDVMHIAVCTLLEPYGYYTFEGRDTDGWPHWKRNEKLPYLKAEQQQAMMKQAILEYFEENGIIDSE